MQLYCERCGPGLWDEPLNAISNVAFPIAAWAGWRLARRHAVLTPGVWVMIAFAVSIGIGSGLWHTFATDWAGVLDVAPITLFQLAFLWLYGRHAVGLPRVAVAALLVGHAALGLWLTRFDEWLNGSLVYLPTIVVGLLTVLHQYVTAGPVTRAAAASVAVFWVSLTARSLDLVVCRQLPIGTHFLWHVLNGLVIYFALYTVIAVYRAKRDARSAELAPT